MSQTSSKKTPILLLALALSGAFAYAAIDTGSAVSVAEIYTVSGTITQSRPLTGCSHSARATVTATYVDGDFVALTARTDDGVVVAATPSAVAARAPDTWCGALSTAPSIIVTASCGTDMLGFDFSIGGVIWTFSSDSGACAAGVNVILPSDGERTPVQPVSFELVATDNPQPAACLGVVQIRIVRQDVATLVPAIAEGSCTSADEADFCATFVDKPGIVGCELQAFPDTQQLSKPGPQEVVQACLYTAPLGLDINGDNDPEFQVPVATVDTGACVASG